MEELQNEYLKIRVENRKTAAGTEAHGNEGRGPAGRKRGNDTARR